MISVDGRWYKRAVMTISVLQVLCLLCIQDAENSILQAHVVTVHIHVFDWTGCQPKRVVGVSRTEEYITALLVAVYIHVFEWTSCHLRRVE